MQLTRRDFSKQALLAGASAALGCAQHVPPAGPQTPPSYPGLPSPASSGIQHVVMVTMENRSFDHFLGWLPNATGQQAGLSYKDPSGVAHATYALSGDWTGCPHNDPDHSYSGSRICYDSGKMDGFLVDTANDIFSIGYYQEADIPFLAALARNYTTCDHYFAAILGPTFANRMFLWAAQTDRLDDSVGISSLPTIFDALAAAGVSHAYYYNNVPYVALWAAKYLGASKLFPSFLSDAANGLLPAVSFLDPAYTVLDDGTGNDDHPHADIREGDQFLYTVFEAITSGPGWAQTVLVINFDEWGGFFEHVAPPRATAANAIDTDIVNGKTLLGFRVPAVIVSPFARGSNPTSPLVNTMVFDHTSVLKLIEWRWGLAPLTPRDASSDINNLAYALNFTSPQTAVPNLAKPSAPLVGAACLQNADGITGLARPGAAARAQLKSQAAGYGFEVR